MALDCCVSGSTAAVHTGDVGPSAHARVRVPLEAIHIFSFNRFLPRISYVVKVTNTEL